MYKLLVVDDEIWIRQRIAETIPWNTVNVDLIETAEDGLEALEKIDDFCPDIIIMDIRMPVLDGIELMHLLQQRSNPPKIIVLSGYDDFSYAKEALKFGAFDYILKPIEDEILLDVVKRCGAAISVEREKKKEIRKLRTAVEQSYEAVREQLLLRIVSGAYQEGEYIRKENTLYSIDSIFSNNMKADKHVCILAHIDCISRIEEKRNIAWFIVHNTMTEILSVYGACCDAFLIETNEILFVLSFMNNVMEDKRYSIYEDIEMIKDLIKEKAQFTISVGIGEICDDFWDLPYAYETARTVMKYRKWIGPNHVYDVDKISAENMTWGRVSTVELDVLLQQDRVEEALEKVKDIFEQVRQKTACGDIIGAYRITAIDIENKYYQYFYRSVNEGYANLFRVDFSNMLEELQSGEEILALIESFCSNREAAVSKRKKMVRRAVDYIVENYKNPVSLNDVSDYLGLNPSYFCRVFKIELGVSFVSFLQNYRINKAIEFMKNPKYKIYEIAGMVGYENQQYFNKVFKKAKGVSPAVYRERL